MDKWTVHFKDMVSNKLPHKSIYVVKDTNQTGSGDVTVVSPTEQAVLQAKSALKRKITNITPVIKGKKFKKIGQSGSGRRKKKKKKAHKKHTPKKKHKK